MMDYTGQPAVARAVENLYDRNSGTAGYGLHAWLGLHGIHVLLHKRIYPREDPHASGSVGGAGVQGARKLRYPPKP